MTKVEVSRAMIYVAAVACRSAEELSSRNAWQLFGFARLPLAVGGEEQALGLRPENCMVKQLRVSSEYWKEVPH